MEVTNNFAIPNQTDIDTDSLLTHIEALSHLMTAASNARDWKLLSSIISPAFKCESGIGSDKLVSREEFLSHCYREAVRFPDAQVRDIDCQAYVSTKSRRAVETVDVMKDAERCGERDGITYRTVCVLTFGRAENGEWKCVRKRSANGGGEI